MNSYDLSRKFIDFSFENPSKIKPNHYALYFFSIEHCNRLGWKKEFGLPTTMTMEAIGIKSYNTYINTFNDLVDFGFFILIEKSKNQYSANIIALSNFDKAPYKALDKALIKHATKHCSITDESIDSINKQVTINNKQINNIPTVQEFLEYAKEKINEFSLEVSDVDLKMKYESWKENDWKTAGNKPKKILNWKTTLLNTLKYLNKKEKSSAKKEKKSAAEALREKYGI